MAELVASMPLVPSNAPRSDDPEAPESGDDVAATAAATPRTLRREQMAERRRQSCIAGLSRIVPIALVAFPLYLATNPTDFLDIPTTTEVANGTALPGEVPTERPTWWMLPLLGMSKKLFTAIAFGDCVLSPKDWSDNPSWAKVALKESLKLASLALATVSIVKDVRIIRAAIAADWWAGLVQALPITIALSSNVPA